MSLKKLACSFETMYFKGNPREKKTGEFSQLTKKALILHLITNIQIQNDQN